MLKLVKMGIAGLFAVGLGISVNVLAADAHDHASDHAMSERLHDAVEYRQGAFIIMGWNFGRMAAMVKGETPYNAEEFTQRANTIQLVSHLPIEGFKDMPESASGKTKMDTAAKTEIWTKFDDFTSKMKALEDASVKLAEVSKQGDLAAIKPVFAETGKTCKSCHDDYKHKD
ncbi:c-type cytochrome [Beggiatoa leptomitoformis]|uniref:Cytochrome c n=1 Tax=Beggiatoa leptomitoformis TaxID=288004 RepID=A0A2N9YFR6_9GAMM|nr:cytochrome c [Beggiatoa leptomitoformis]ALG68351.1 cytochrome c [Beggiatoa leptomitoformis]AUI69330.1 cytochrome c [Beggiatoa leptomitoformis]